MTQRNQHAKARFFLHFLILIIAIAGPGNSDAQEFMSSSPLGGKQQLKEFFNEHLVYPASELKAGKEGNVALAFDIDTDGKIAHLKVLQSVSLAITKEAIRLFNLLLWEPATYRGKAVADHQEITIPFNIKHYLKICRLRGYDTIVFPFHPSDTSLRIYAYRQLDTSPKPVFNKKDVSYESFMSENYHYPDLAYKQNISGVVIVNFIVEPYGLISNVNVEKRLGAGCTEEAIRLIKLLRWMPGIVDGNAVRVLMNLSITFSLDGKNKFDYQPNQASNSMN